MRQYVGDDEDLPRWNWEEIGGGVVLDQADGEVGSGVQQRDTC